MLHDVMLFVRDRIIGKHIRSNPSQTLTDGKQVFKVQTNTRATRAQECARTDMLML